MARSLRALAERARALYGGELDLLVYEIRMEEAWREFVHQAGDCYRVSTAIALTPSTREFTLPTDYREMLGKPYLWYTARTISAIARVSDVVTVTTSTAHGLSAGMKVTIADVTPVGSTTFDGTFTVVGAADTTHFTYADTQDDDTGTGGTVGCMYSPFALERMNYWEMELGPSADETASTPYHYFFPDAVTIGVYPISDGTYPALFLEYDAEAPDTLDTSTALPVPAYIERGLMAYAAAMSGKLDKVEGLTLFADSVRTWKAAQTLKEY